jgi:hypothetical protein
MEGGRTVCEGKQILKFNTIARKQVKNGRAFKGYVVFRQGEIFFTCDITLFERHKCVYRIPKQIGCIRVGRIKFVPFKNSHDFRIIS